MSEVKKRCAALADDDEMDELGMGPEDAARKFAGGCGFLQPHYKIDATVLYVQFPEGDEEAQKGEDRRRPMSAEETLAIFRRISDKDSMSFTPCCIR